MEPEEKDMHTHHNYFTKELILPAYFIKGYFWEPSFIQQIIEKIE